MRTKIYTLNSAGEQEVKSISSIRELDHTHKVITSIEFVSEEFSNGTLTIEVPDITLTQAVVQVQKTVGQTIELAPTSSWTYDQEQERIVITSAPYDGRLLMVLADTEGTESIPTLITHKDSYTIEGTPGPDLIFDNPIPTLPTKGDLLILSVTMHGVNAITTVPEGWLHIVDMQANGLSHHILYKISDGTETSAPITMTGNVHTVVAYLSYDGSKVDQIHPIRIAESVSSNVVADSLRIIATTPKVFSGTVLAFAAVDTHVNVGQPMHSAGYTNQLYSVESSALGTYTSVWAKPFHGDKPATNILSHSAGQGYLVHTLIGIQHRPNKYDGKALDHQVMMVVGDSGVTDKSAEDVAKLVIATNPDSVLSTGDQAYHNGTLADYTAAFLPDNKYGLFHSTDPLANRFWPSLGWHDYGQGSNPAHLDGNYLFDGSVGVFTLPLNPSGHARYYAVREGDIHHVHLDSTRAGDPAYRAEQAAFMHSVFAASDAKFKIVLFYDNIASVQAPVQINADMSDPAWFFVQHCDLVITGRSNTAQHIKMAGGLDVVVTGNGGASLQDSWDGGAVQGTDYEFRGAYFGAFKMVVEGDILNCSFVDTDNVVKHSFTIDKS